MSDFLGTGWAFPVEVDARGRIALARHERDIEECAQITLVEMLAISGWPKFRNSICRLFSRLL